MVNGENMNSASSVKSGIIGGLSGNALKIIAIICMTIDHLGAFFVLPLFLSIYGTDIDYNILNNIVMSMRIVGRLAFPIFCFLTVQGFLYTKNLKNYIALMFVFALVSEIPFNLIFNISAGQPHNIFNANYQNVMFTLTLGLLCLYIMKYVKVSIFLRATAILIISFFAELLNTDYGAMGVMTVVMLYLFYARKLSIAVILLWLALSFYAYYVVVSLFSGLSLPMAINANSYSGILQGTCAFSMLLINFYNGQRGVKLPKLLFYMFYPVHILVIYAFILLMQ